VRPEPVLREALAALIAKPERNYWYDNDQLKAMRQDLTVQRIRTAFTCEVYECHARLALKSGDWGEFNQCHTVLSGLYKEGLPGCTTEFLAYRVLYSTFNGSSSVQMLAVLAQLSAEVLSDAAVAHALAVREATVSSNWVAFFKLYPKTPNTGGELMDLYKDTMRFTACKAMTRGFRPTVPVEELAAWLGFELEEECAGGPETGPAMPPAVVCVRWLQEHGAVLTTTEEPELDCKASMATLFVPDKSNAVSHGDPNLSAADFLANI